MHTSLSIPIMADNIVSEQLYNELRQRFPEVPPDVVTKLMRQNSCNRVKCIEALGRESNNYLYQHVGPTFNDMYISSSKNGEVDHNFRPRANSGDSPASVSIGIAQRPAQYYNPTYPETSFSYHNPNLNRQMQIQITRKPHPQYSGNQWNEEYQPSPQSYPYQPPPPVQRPYSNQENRSVVPPMSLQFAEGFPNNGQNIGSPGTPTSKATYVNKGTPNTPPVNPFVQTMQSPEHSYSNNSFSSQVLIPRQQGLYDQNRYKQYQPLQPNQNQTYATTHIIIPVPSSIRTPSPSQPPPDSFYDSSNVRPCHPDSFPSFPLNQQRSTDSNPSPSTPIHTFPHVFQQGLQSPVNRQDQNAMHKVRVAFQIPEVTDLKGKLEENQISSTSHMCNVDNYKTSYVTPDVTVDNNATGFPNSSHENGQIVVQHPGGITRDRSRSIEETQYLQTLLAYQKQRQSKLSEDLDDSYRLLRKMQSEVSSMEKDMLTRKKSRTNYTVTADDVHKIRQENRRLQFDIQLLTREIDLNNSEAPLGIFEQNFYERLDPGQVLSPSNSSSRPCTPPRIPPRPPPEIHHPPPRDIIQPPPVRPPRPPPPLAQPEVPEEVDNRENWKCSACTFLNHPDLDKCEMCEMPRLSSGITGY